MLVLPVQSPAETFESTDKYPRYWMLVCVEKGTTSCSRIYFIRGLRGKAHSLPRLYGPKTRSFSHVNKEKIVSFQRPINPCSLETALTFPVIRTLSKSEFVFRRFCGCASTCSCTCTCVRRSLKMVRFVFETRLFSSPNGYESLRATRRAAANKLCHLCEHAIRSTNN